MRFIWLAALACAILGCGDKKEVGGKPIGEPPGFRFVRESDPVGTTLYERGIQWIGSDKAPEAGGTLTQLAHPAKAGSVFAGQEVVTIKYSSGIESEIPKSLFYGNGTMFVKE